METLFRNGSLHGKFFQANEVALGFTHGDSGIFEIGLLDAHVRLGFIVIQLDQRLTFLHRVAKRNEHLDNGMENRRRNDSLAIVEALRLS